MAANISHPNLDSPDRIGVRTGDDLDDSVQMSVSPLSDARMSLRSSVGFLTATAAPIASIDAGSRSSQVQDDR